MASKKSSSQKSPYHIDTDLQDKIVNLFEKVLVHRQGDLQGQHIILEDWQKNFITQLLCVVDKNGRRKHRKAFLFVPRKNGKTLLISSLAIAILLFLPEKGQQVVIGASSFKQASILWENCAFMVNSSPILKQHLEPRQGRIIKKDVNAPGEILIVSADASTLDGLNASCFVIDELHQQPNRDLYDVLCTSQGARKNPLQILITTAGSRKESLCYEEYQLAKKIRDGIIEDPTYLPVLYECDPDDPWDAPETWAKSNPNWLVSVEKSYMTEQVNAAKNSPALVPALKRLNLNLWVESETHWIDMERWAACAGDIAAQDLPDFLAGRRCYGGLDLSTKIDLTAFCLCFPPEKKGDRYHIISHCFMPKSSLQKAIKRDKVPYDQWEKQGFLTALPGHEIDQQAIYDYIMQMTEKYDFRYLGYDPFLADWLEKELDKSGKITVIKYFQKFWAMSPANLNLQAGILGEKLAHGNDPLLRWAASNVEAKARGDEIMLVKPDRQRHAIRIDPIVALSIAYDLCVRREGTPEKPKVSAVRRYGMLT
jgi:phage terminase large subunit-like protein